MPTTTNLHWKYYFDYFRKENPQFLVDYMAEPGTKTTRFNGLTDHKNDLLEIIPDRYPLTIWQSLKQGCPEHRFTLTTTYPGLLVGSGYRHETNSNDELKLGFSFDYTTGLPIIPGSSVKGLLRSAFPGDKKKNSLYDRSIQFIHYLLQEGEVGLSADKAEKINVPDLETELFGPLPQNERSSKSESMWQSPIFYDALIGIDWEDNVFSRKLFGNDFITPHRNRANPRMSPFTNPTPIQFLKVMPNVPVTFQFDLPLKRNGQLLEPTQKLELFKTIIAELGVGAKTRVGYGQFADTVPTSQQPPGKELTDRSQSQRVAEPFMGRVRPGVELDAEYIRPVANMKNRHECKAWLAPAGSDSKEIAVVCIYGSPLKAGQIIRIQVKDGRDKINLAEIVKVYQV